MYETEKLWLVKLASGETALNALRSLAPSAAMPALLPAIPWNTLRDIKHNISGTAGNDELPRSAITDASRAIGGAIGGASAVGLGQAWHLNGSPLSRAALLLGGVGVGSTLGHMKGQHIGQELFPGSLRDRLNHAVSTF
jgi:hypothetical protein